MPTASEIVLTDDQRETLMSLGALGWSEDDIAVYFGWDKRLLHSLTVDPDSEISVLLLRGRLQNRAKIEIRLMNDAIGGNLTAAKQFSDIMRDKSFEVSKLDIFGGPADEGAFERIQNYIAKGCPGTLSGNEQLYIDLLVMIYSLDGQHGKRKTIRFLCRTVCRGDGDVFCQSKSVERGFASEIRRTFRYVVRLDNGSSQNAERLRNRRESAHATGESAPSRPERPRDLARR